MTYFSVKDFDTLDKIFRLNLINSCSGYKSANLLGTRSKKGIENVAIFSSITHLGSNPALLGFFLRPKTVPRNTYENLIETGFYTINHIHEEILIDAHHTSAKYDKDLSEFDYTNLRAEYKKDIAVPFVMGAPLQILMKYKEEYEIMANNTILIVGAIEGIYIQDHLLDTDGFVQLSRAKIACINGLDGYAIPELKTRYGYQRPC